MLFSLMRRAAHAARSVLGTNGLSSRLTALESKVQEALDRSFSSLEEAKSREVMPVAAGVSDQVAISAPSLDINYLLHHSRGALLRTMPPNAQRLLSAGCAGAWYFDWIEQTYGRVPEHLGIEFYSPKPDDLPQNVTWIANTASDMSAVKAGSCDLVFSGQNLEHLCPEEVSGFFLEAARVLAPGGHLVIDSPNRLITAPLNWSHPEHTIELTPAEAIELMRLAGFDITATYGIWLCQDVRNGKILAFDPNVPEPNWSITERLILARDRPEASFIWWIEGIRSQRAPDAALTHLRMLELFRQHWPERVQRLLVPDGHTSHMTEEGKWIEALPGQSGIIIYGPYIPLRAGRHRVTWQIKSADSTNIPGAVFDVIARDHPEELGRYEANGDDTRVSIEFCLSETTFGLQFRYASMGGAGFSVLRRIWLDQDIDA